MHFISGNKHDYNILTFSPNVEKKLADLLGSTERNLELLYAELESKVAWQLALAGLRTFYPTADLIESAHSHA